MTGRPGLAAEGPVAGAWRFVSRPAPRRIGYAIAAIILLILVFFPQRYLARVQMLPQDENAAGLSAVLGTLGGGLQNFATLIGSHETIEVYLIIGRSNAVEVDVINRLHLLGKPGFRDLDQALLTLRKKLDIHTITGGVLEIEVRDSDPRFARELASAYAAAIEDRVGSLSREQTTKKKAIVEARFRATILDLAHAQAAMDAFRRANNLAEPNAQLGQAVSSKAALEDQLRLTQVELATAQQFETPDNIHVKTLMAQVASLRAAIAQSEGGDVSGQGVQAIASKSEQYMNLYRDERFQEALYDIYSRTLEQVAVETLTSEANTNVQIIEEPFLLPERQYNLPALGGLIFLLILAVATELYIPLTGLGGLRRSPRTSRAPQATSVSE